MSLPDRRRACSLVINVFLLSVLCLPTVCSAIINVRQQQDEPLPFEMVGIIRALKERALPNKMLKERLIEKVTKQGVNFRLTAADERDIRRYGSYLGRQALDDITTVIRINYRPASINEDIMMRPGMPSLVDYLNFQATYIKKVGDDYLIKIKHPGIDEISLKTHSGCEHPFKFGRRDLVFVITEASPEQIKATLIDRVKHSNSVESTGDTPAPRVSVRLSECIAISMQLVTGNYVESQNLSISPYYISEPITVGVFRLYAKTNAVKTHIPPEAKDSDYITAIYYQDAFAIARMMDADLPSLTQWVNAYNAGAVRLTSGTELVASEGGKLSTVQEATSSSPANTLLSSRIFTNLQLENINSPPRGLLRVVRPTDPYPIRYNMPKNPAQRAEPKD